MKKSLAVVAALAWLVAGCAMATSATLTTTSPTTTTLAQERTAISTAPLWNPITQASEASGNLHDEVNKIYLATQAAARQFQEDKTLIEQLFAVNPFSNGLDDAYSYMADHDYPALGCSAADIEAFHHFPQGYEGQWIVDASTIEPETPAPAGITEPPAARNYRLKATLEANQSWGTAGRPGETREINATVLDDQAYWWVPCDAPSTRSSVDLPHLQRGGHDAGVTIQ